MKLKNFLYLAVFGGSAAALLSMGSSIPSSSAADDSRISIAYSSNIHGYMEPCG